MEVVVVNSVASKSGGGLVVLKEFINNIPKNSNIRYVIFTSIGAVLECDNHAQIQFVKISPRGRIGGLFWLFWGLNRWCEKNHIVPSLLVSLQNTGAYLKKSIPQIVYYHQSIPLMKYNWSVLKKRERNLWYYKNIYPKVVKSLIRKNTYFVVQQNFLIELMCKTYNISSNQIKVFRPDVTISLDNCNAYNLGSRYKLFYPAAAHLYKNHMEIPKMLKFLRDSGESINDYCVYLTVAEKDTPELYDYIKINDLENNFVFLGEVSHEKVLDYYLSTDLLIYPSYIECFTLPLLEITKFMKPILAADTDYAREQIQGYSGAFFAEVNNSELWGRQLLNIRNCKASSYIWHGFSEPSWTGLFEFINKVLIEGRE